MMCRLKRKIILSLVIILVIVGISPNCVSAKGRTGFYVGGESNVRRVAVKKITKKYIYFDMLYSGMKECVAENVRANKKNGKFQYKDDRGSKGNGIIKLSSNYVKIRVRGIGFLTTNNEWRKLKWVSDSTDIWTVY